MSQQPVKIRPGLLVSLKTAINGGVKYTRRVFDKSETESVANALNVPNEQEVAAWETVRVTEDPAEHADAVKVRNGAGALVRKPCIQSVFGLLCPVERREKLDAAIVEARALVDAFNAKARTVRVDVWIIMGLIVSDDMEAVRAISAEVRSLVDTMKVGISEADVDKIREAANKARLLGGMLDPEAADKVAEAVQEARAAASQLRKRVIDGGELVEKVVAEIEIKALDEARFAFLDMEAPAAVPGEQLPPAAVPALPDLNLDDGASADSAVGLGDDPSATSEAPPETETPDDVDASAAVDADVAEFRAAAV